MGACSGLVNRCLVKSKLIPLGCLGPRVPQEALAAMALPFSIGARHPAAAHFLSHMLPGAFESHTAELVSAFCKARPLAADHMIILQPLPLARNHKINGSSCAVRSIFSLRRKTRHLPSGRPVSGVLSHPERKCIPGEWRFY
jgi:hypothetical protein